MRQIFGFSSDLFWFVPWESGMSDDAGGTPFKKGPWTAAEDAMLVDYVKKNGEGNWNSVQKKTRLLRCGKSCRLRWSNHLRPNLKKCAISPDEERIILKLHAQFGNKWARMAAELPGRTDNEIKNYWNTRTKRHQRHGLPLYPPDIQPQATAMHNQNALYPPVVNYGLLAGHHQPQVQSFVFNAPPAPAPMTLLDQYVQAQPLSMVELPSNQVVDENASLSPYIGPLMPAESQQMLLSNVDQLLSNDDALFLQGGDAAKTLDLGNLLDRWTCVPSYSGNATIAQEDLSTMAPAMDEDLSTIPTLFPETGFVHSDWYVASWEATNELPYMSSDVDLKELASTVTVVSPRAAATATAMATTTTATTTTTTTTTTNTTTTTTTDGLQGWSLRSG